MASIFDKVNARLPALLRPGSRLRTKAANIKPLIALKKFALKTVKLAKKLKVLIPRRARNFASNVYTPKAALRSKLGADFDSAIHNRSIRRTDTGKLVEQFRLKGEKYGTESAKQEAQELMDAFIKLQPALEAFISGADARTERYKGKLSDIEQEFTKGVKHLKDIAWADMLRFLEGKSSEEATKWQSLHQLVFGTSKVKAGSGERLHGLKHFVQEINANPSLKEEGETTFESALRMMTEEWSVHERSVKKQLKSWEKSRDVSSARKYQHHMAFLESVASLKKMTNDFDLNAAREEKQQFLGRYGELFGVQGGVPIASKYLQGLKDIESDVDSGNETEPEDDFFTDQADSDNESAGTKKQGDDLSGSSGFGSETTNRSGLRRRRKTSSRDREVQEQNFYERRSSGGSSYDSDSD
ncbi:hypothetical protein GZ77_16425 [Endozoicomonas montiporae]|uniref:Uncharacterized protein n=2 Tax=Endozoicomonas montiporae TaxID=1027273 RepID=A0A081N5X7_9GAMM|nr:hypothetical protein [Endozoicomonas montiporae]AMO57243.1 hypothetical protein EZMO1_3243 [Endozoicomonas montiporae CL-33]KEQ13850.1 hypothetical protein GZ77_16425 [Endozoicomonas montiporae]